VQRPVKYFSLFVLIAAAFAACNRTEGGEAGKDTAIAATVNGKSIMLSEVDRLLRQQSGGQEDKMSPLQLAAARLQILDGLIQQEVLFQRAEEEKLMPTEDEITQAINTQKQQNRWTEEEYQNFLRETNQTEPMLRETVRRQVAIQKLQDKVNSKINIPSDKEVEDFYNNNKQQFVNARGVGLAAIVVDPADNGLQDDAKNEVEAKQKIDLIYQRLKSGADFATVARAQSEDTASNAAGGDIGFFSEEQLKQRGAPDDLIANFFGPMQVGDITAPVRVGSGRWYIFKLTRKQLQNENLTLDSPGVRDQIKDALMNQRRALVNAALLTVAMNKARVENRLAQNVVNNPGNLTGLRPAPAAGASPAATPAQTAATPAATASPAASASPQK
jgi:parvulin-like peptidyl-prolyl isomerase